MRRLRFQQSLTHLALLAMLLLAFVPTASRLLASAGLATGGSWVELCTVTGLKWVQLPEGDAAPSHSAQMGEDCAYCPLLNAVAVFALLLALLLPAAPRELLERFARLQRTVSRHPCGLGSRGPPLAL
ncbi:DUF2946 family protein [Arenimonas sp.]|uniref:DUF2946 family protein n=1 Tax=Arenimonas sp. TaxID=1872635 RepID=UPI0039E39CF7